MRRTLITGALLAGALAGPAVAAAAPPTIPNLRYGPGSSEVVGPNGNVVACPGVQKTFTPPDTSATYAWMTPSGTGAITAGRRASYSVVASNADGQSAPFRFTFGVDAPTLSSLTASTTTPMRRQAVTLTATGQSVGGCPLSYEWDFNGDGKYDDATGASVSYKPTVAGQPVTLRGRVSDMAGPGTDRTSTLNVQTNRAPTGTVSGGGRLLLLGESAAVGAVSLADVDGDIAGVQWDYDGDGGTDATEMTTTIPATHAGQAPVLRIVDDLGAVTKVPVGITTSGPASVGVPGAVVTASYTDKTGRGLTNAQREALRQTGVFDGVTLQVPVTLSNVRTGAVSVVLGGKLAKRLGIPSDGTTPVEIASGTATQTFFGEGQTTPVGVTPTDAGRRVFARIRRLPVTVRVSSVNGFGAPVTAEAAAVLQEAKGSTGRPKTTLPRVTLRIAPLPRAALRDGGLRSPDGPP